MPELSQEIERGRALLPFGAAEVTGPSMVPTLYHGDQLVVQYGARVRPGDVVVLRHPFQQDLLVVKRAVRALDGGWEPASDNEFATGPTGVADVEARVLWRYRKGRRD